MTTLSKLNVLRLFTRIESGKINPSWLEGKKQETLKVKAKEGKPPPSLTDLEETTKSNLKWLTGEVKYNNKAQEQELRSKTRAPSGKKNLAAVEVLRKFKTNLARQMARITNDFSCTGTNGQCLKSSCPKHEGLFQRAMVHVCENFFQDDEASTEDKPCLVTIVLDGKPAKDDNGINSPLFMSHIEKQKADAIEIFTTMDVDYFIGCFDVNYRIDTINGTASWSPHIHGIMKMSDYKKCYDSWCRKLKDKSLANNYFDAKEIAHVNEIGSTVAYIFKRLTARNNYRRSQRYLDKSNNPNSREKPLSVEQMYNLLMFLNKITLLEKPIIHGVRLAYDSKVDRFSFQRSSEENGVEPYSPEFKAHLEILHSFKSSNAGEIENMSEDAGMVENYTDAYNPAFTKYLKSIQPKMPPRKPH